MFNNDLMFQLLFLTILLYLTGAVPNVKTSKDNCIGRAACDANAGPRRAVCGTDGRTYQSRCHLIKAQCSGEPVAMARKGPCAGSALYPFVRLLKQGIQAISITNFIQIQEFQREEGQSSCLIALRYALSGQKGRRANFVPRCRADGTYAAVQCAAAGAAAGCWCVTPDGKPLQDTAVRNGRPNCTNTGCTRADRVLFNGNLIKIFSGEYDRARSGGPMPDPRTVAEWKFRELDRDRTGALQKSEYRGLRRLIKKMVKPKRCARAWARGCDGDGDGAIALAEWESCLLASPEPPAPDYEDSGPEPEVDYTEEDPPPDPSAVLPGIIRHSFAPDGADAESRREDDANDCLTDRQAVLDEQQKAGAAALYVPECTGDGRYARAQCYRSTGYCWCVHQDTGKPIPGSSVKDRRPDCDSAPQHASPMRGCPEPMKSNFLRDLMRFFITKMGATTNGTGDLVKWGASKEEKAATWTFVMLDKDKNKALERREWKSFHQLIANVEPLRRCGRKLPRYCDVNHDARISITEWMACLEVTQASQGQTTETAKVANPRRKGPNPLESILKADD